MDTELIKNIPIFEALNQDEKSSIAGHFVMRRHVKNTIVINEGDETNSLYIILSGRVKIYLNDATGKEVILNVQDCGDYFGEISLLDGGPRSASVMTLEDCHFAVLNKQDFIHALTNNPELSLSIIRGLTLRMRELSENIRSLALTDVYGRVVKVLTNLSEEQEDGRRIIREHLTYNELANRIGASSKMVSRIMKELKKGEYIRKESQQIIIERDLPSAW